MTTLKDIAIILPYYLLISWIKNTRYEGTTFYKVNDY